MDIKAYISSGILEQYVLDKLPESQRLEVEGMARAYPEVQAEIDAIETALESYALSQAVTPSDDLLDKIQSRLTPKTPAKTLPVASKLPLILGAIIGLLLMGAIYYLYTSGNKEKAAKTALLEQLLQQEIECDEVAQENRRLLEQLNILRDPSNQTIIMRGTPLSPKAVASVYWNQEKQTAYLDVIELPEHDQEKQYQLWAIVDTGPQSLGVFDLPAADTIVFNTLEFVDNPAAFAVTLEPRGGSVGPTLDAMYVLGSRGE
ncbi:MAG TPA: anti-sigma factor [Saprospiraceae bacterium]|nr:anti-sigma factor [Saprospiraceae bacterium]HMQ83543.1 anti-sigma factor [Saprospiraceae bacterium]